MYLPTDDQFWSKQDRSKPDIAFLKNHFYREGRLTEEQALYILEKYAAKCSSQLTTGVARSSAPSPTSWRSTRPSLVRGSSAIRAQR